MCSILLDDALYTGGCIIHTGNYKDSNSLAVCVCVSVWLMS